MTLTLTDIERSSTESRRLNMEKKNEPITYRLDCSASLKP